MLHPAGPTRDLNTEPENCISCIFMGNIFLGFSDAQILFVPQKSILEIIAGFSNSARTTFLVKLEDLQIKNVFCVLH